MIKEKNAIRNKWINLRLSEKEYQLMKDQFSKTSERKISAYARKILLGKPVIGAVRNLSQEALITEFSKLLKELNGAANNFNQAVHKLHILDSVPQYQQWVMKYEMDKRQLMRDVEEIKKIINQQAALWLQS